jgi:SAM-dependent methyltransferase
MTDNYYDDLAPFYKYIYPDWEASAWRQANALHGVIQEYAGDDANSILDAACGIGTQCLGLAELGYQVTASDLSQDELHQAQQEAEKRGLAIEFQVADMRRVWDTFQREFAVVMACDNAVPHLLTEADILQAFRQFFRCTQAGGICIITVRDYALLEKPANGQKLYPRSVHKTSEGQMVMFDTWDFEGDFYQITTYIVEDMGGTIAQTHILRGGKYYCVEIQALERLFLKAGFKSVETLRQRFFQPLIVARK